VLSLPDRWIWDSWTADDGERFHLFFLQAPSALGDPALRHEAATIGHATSSDLAHWEIHDDALGAGPDGFDDLAVWTGSVTRADDGTWRLYYTGLSTAGHGVRDQRLGLAVSDDLFAWRRAGGGRPLLEADPRWYRTLDGAGPASETWRDPFVFRDPGGDGWHMLITARDARAPRLSDGVIGHARSADGLRWTLGPPVGGPSGFGQIEVPQARLVEGRPLLVFSCHPEEQDERHTSRFGHFSTWSVPGDSLTGPWDLEAARPFEADPKLFGAPLVQIRDGGWVLFGFQHTESEGVLSFELGDPIPVGLDADGCLTAR
jgi:beta-fructofuranosidase